MKKTIDDVIKETAEARKDEKLPWDEEPSKWKIVRVIERWLKDDTGRDAKDGEDSVK